MKIVVLLLFMLPMITFAESKVDIATDIILLDDDIKEKTKTLEDFFKSQREAMIVIFKPSYQDSQEILSMEELLYLEVKNSDLFQIDFDIIFNAAVIDLADFLTKEELLELRDIYSSPVFKKLSAVGEKFMLSTASHIESWQEKNEKLMESFKKRRDEIYQMKKDHLEAQAADEE